MDKSSDARTVGDCVRHNRRVHVPPYTYKGTERAADANLASEDRATAEEQPERRGEGCSDGQGRIGPALFVCASEHRDLLNRISSNAINLEGLVAEHPPTNQPTDPSIIVTATPSFIVSALKADREGLWALRRNSTSLGT